ncbi:MAG: 2-hydroxy-3-oxopropionate reductase [Alphaproteobacteria bacterium MarineAlpha11_Bin1]|nr:MAG: 2-hydroxy-3-oxopropionate reductase [Alphaproteobacteria bacterium MarineAlpha11_Bin1]|tara:strand:- start:791 stop:1669 length:879 start_codon:yes stop_codon:yes gene_type:complete
MSEKGTAAFVGLGVMGYPMAGHLASNGYEMRVYNRTGSKSEQWVGSHKGTAHSTPAEAAGGADFVMTCVGNDDDLRSVVLGEAGVFSGMKEGGVLIDHTTTSAIVARELAEEARNRGLGFLDAPVSGGQAGAENGALTIMVGGVSEVFDGCEAVMKSYGKTVIRMGGVGAGQLTKMVNQICIAGLVQGLSEAMNFAIRAGLDAKRAAEVMSGGAAQSWQMDNRAASMVAGEFEFGFAVDWMRKDLGICLEEAQTNGARLPITEIVDGYYADVQAKGGNRYDTSSLILNLQDN